MKKLMLAFTACAAFFLGMVAFADGGSDVTTHPSGDWVVTKLTADASECVITEGTLKYAYGTKGSRTVNGVTFADNSMLKNATDNIEAVPAYGYDKNDHNNNDQGVGVITDNDWKTLLGTGWLNNESKPADSTFTFKGLTKGNVYKVQLLIHNGYNKDNPARSIFTPDGQEGFYSQSSTGDHSDWDLGCSLVGTFIATNTEHQLTFSYSSKATNWKNLNAIQLRDLGAYVPVSVNTRAATMIPGDWLVCPLAGEPGDIVTRGTLVQKGGCGQAFCSVDIAGDDSLAGLSFNGKSYGFVESYSCFQVDLWGNYAASGLGDCGVTGGYGTLLANGWAGNNQQPGRVLNLNSIEAGKLYLLQGIVHDGTHPGHQLTIANKTITYGAADSSESWYYGGTFVHLFKATGSSMAIDLSYTPYGALLNGVQLRQLPDVTMPSIGSASAAVDDTTATITISDVEVGEGWDASAATSYDVYAKLNDKEFAKVAENVSETTASFAYTDLDAGAYDCTIYIVNNKGVQSAEKVASFEIGSVEPQTYVVTNATDNFSAPVEGSLRWVLSKVRAGDTVTFDKEKMGTDTIKIAEINVVKADTSLVIRKAVTIEGNGVIIDGGAVKNSNDNGSRIFLVPAGIHGEVVFRNLELTHGHARNWDSLGGAFIYGGAVCAYSPVWIDQCNIHDCYSRFRPGSSTGQIIAWGPVLYAETAVRITNTILDDNGHVDGSYCYGGALLVNGGSLTMKNVVARRNTSVSWGGGLLFATANSPLSFENCQIEDCRGHDGGGAIRIVQKDSQPGDGVERIFRRCSFRRCYSENDGSNGGAILCDESVKGRCIFDSCEFDDCHAKWGGAVRLNSPYGMFVNCTFRLCNGSEWGPAIDIRNGADIVNCTFVGCFDTKNASDTSAAIFCCGGTVNILNSVGAFNYYNACNSPSVNDDAHQYSGTRCFYNSVMNAKVWGAKNKDEGDFDCFTTPIFTGEMETNTSIRVNNTLYNLAKPCAIPTWYPDPKGAYASKVIGIVKGGLLDGTGWPVKANADYTHICYSADGGTTWTDLYKNGTPDDSTLELITKDQRGVAYYKGKTPIGAATIEPTAGMYLIIR